MNYPIERIRCDFLVLAQQVNGQPLAYLDSAASAQKPQAVIDREVAFYSREVAFYSNNVVCRGAPWY
ncbi:MAG: aminotransferase class V-fold PLP-dependent enzyme [Symbiopectobacterium sp.]